MRAVAGEVAKSANKDVAMIAGSPLKTCMLAS
jgi:hypothetical protein